MDEPNRPRSGPGHYLRDMVYGASDGVTTTMAVIAGSAGAGFAPSVAIVLGLANLAADGMSMGVSNYLGLSSELEQTGGSHQEEQPWRHGVATTLAFMVAGAVPLLVYCFRLSNESLRFPLAALLAAITLVGVGGARSLFLRRSALRCGLEMLAIAGGVNAAAYALGWLIEPYTR